MPAHTAAKLALLKNTLNKKHCEIVAIAKESKKRKRTTILEY